MRRAPEISRCLLVALLLCVARQAQADEIVTKHAVFEERGGQLQLSVGFRELFDRPLRDRLRSGFATQVVMRAYLYEQGGGTPLGVWARSVRAVYDLWDESYLLTTEEAGLTTRRRLSSEGATVDRLTSFWRFSLGRARTIPRQRNHFVAVIVEVNPMSAELLAQVRRWLRRPDGLHRSVSGDNFFGSFVSLFVNNKVRRAERALLFRTQLFFRR